MRFLTWLATNAIGLAAAAWAFDGIRFVGPAQGAPEVREKLLPLLAVALILGLVSATVKPVLKFLSFPIVLLTLGLFLLLINAAMLGLTGWLAAQLDIGFRVHGFWTAVGGALVITVVTWFVDRAVGPEQRR